MRGLIKIGFVGALSLLTPALAQAEPQDVALTCVRQDHEFTLKMGLGRYTAVHFLPRTDEGASAVVKEYFEKAPTVAGVFHVFVNSGDAMGLKTWASQYKDMDLMIGSDPGGLLASECRLAAKVTKGLPASVVFDPQGHELFRQEGTTDQDYLRFAAFSAKLDQKWRANTAEYNLPKGKTLALEGYDPVSYFTSGAAKGKAELTSQYRGVTYQFASAENRKLFAADPEKYLPTYGGWCATGLGKAGKKIEIDPTNYKVSNGRLFLFYKSLLADAKTDWDKHEKEWEPAADKAWKGFSGEERMMATEKK
jgi:YHS domain-containing protein